MRGTRLLRYCEERPARGPRGRVLAAGAVHAARPGAFVTLCGAGVETLHLLGIESGEGELCPRCWPEG